ncbi:2-succinyl-6-hydroxy-2,4-cyclohexadiene-1-carboxylate synthase [Fredinandcohnia sp. 179-A 10B2 NHS]|uniref:2-succinyl-6-hydroxy-2, 4-cyclohexadiene-1-carboxylate synthase n=1 Tax=Fredinandcohnia sp. 179-A 10B2 NHS TaxID=3235176 RepID=UPI0039A12614
MNIVSNGVNYNVRIVGQGEPLLLLHGFTGSIGNWDELIKGFETKFTCVLVDIIGHGKTDSPSNYERYSIETVAKDIIMILDSLHFKKVNVLGYSMGGRLALALALLYQERVSSLILESSSPGLRNEEERESRIELDRILANMIEEKGIKEFVSHWEGIPLFASQKRLSVEKRDNIRSQRLRNNPLGLANSLRGMGTGSQPSYWEQLSTLSVPTLLICGEFDSKFCLLADNMSKTIPNATVKKIKDAGHAIHVELPEIFGKIVIEFVFDQI